MTTEEHYGKTAFYGVATMFTGTFGRTLVAFGANMVLTRILVPEEFGLVAVVLSVVALLQMFAELGTSVALVQKKQVTDLDRDSAFTITLVVTSFFLVLLYVSAGGLATFFEMPGLEPLLKIAAVSYAFLGLYSLQRSILLRDLRYRTIAILEFVGVLLSSLTAVALAYRGYGPASVIWGHVVYSVFLLLFGSLSTRYLPRSFGKIATMKELFGFGVWVAISHVLGDTSQHLDKFMIAKLIDARALGGYYLAQKIVMLIPSVFTGAINQVMFPIYSRFQDDIGKIERGYWLGLRFSALAILPAMCLLNILAEPLIGIVYGDRWLSIVPLVRILTVFGALQSLGGGLFASVIYAVGRPKLMLWINVFRVTVLPLCLVVGSRWGVEGIAWGLVAFGFLGRIFNQLILTRSLGFGLLRFFTVIALPVLVNVVIAAICQIVYSRLDAGAIGQIGLISVIYLICYAVACMTVFSRDVSLARSAVFTGEAK